MYEKIEFHQTIKLSLNFIYKYGNKNEKYLHKAFYSNMQKVNRYKYRLDRLQFESIHSSQ